MISLGVNNAELLTPMEIDAIGEILNISLGSSATSVSQLLGQQVNITTPEVKLVKTSEFDIRLYEPAIGVEIKYVSGLTGKNILILKEEDVKVIVGLLLQTDFSDREFVLDEMNIGAICEVMNQMMGASATALSQFLNRSIIISPPTSFPIQSGDEFREKYLSGSEDIVAVYFDLSIGNVVKSKFINLMRTDLAKELVANFQLDGGEEENAQSSAESAPAVAPSAPTAAAAPAAPATPPVAPAASAPAAPTTPPVAPAAPAAPTVTATAPATPTPPASATAPAAPANAPAPQPVPTAGSVAPAPGAVSSVPPAATPYPAAPMQAPYYAPPANYSVTNAVYPNFDNAAPSLTQNETNNLNMIMSVPLQITVEIGRTSKKIKDILEFTTGTIVELNRQAGSQVDVLVNGKAIAKGNVVVVDDNYGVRITEVINSELMKLI
ncbi:flagellar motor switch phosphatase FliY [Thermocaproicibacter melissae]|uniref:flagellar motor switch phosphatase FliY n=1 Tax=Thermocaproicibacter melissae TaxID=2966552 RepID=UPI003A1029E5